MIEHGASLGEFMRKMVPLAGVDDLYYEVISFEDFMGMLFLSFLG
jgi:hypothetical protein